MKQTARIILLSLAMASANFAFAQKPEQIISFAKIPRSGQYFTAQKVLWEKEVKKNKKNANAWMNYYRATRYSVNLDTTLKLTNDEKHKILNGIIDEMGKKVPKSYEYNHVMWMSGGLDLNQYPYLEKAYKLNPEEPKVWVDMATYAEVVHDTATRQKFMKKLYAAGEQSPGLLNYNYNVMAGLEPNAILFSLGDNDTYPVWQLQAAKGFRKDIKVLNVSLMHIPEYRDRIFRELGIPKMDEKLTDMTTDGGSNYRKSLIRYVAENQKRPVYIVLCGDEDVTTDIKDKLYVTGLALKYAGERFDNLAILKRNFEQNYATDYLRMSFSPDISEGIVKMMNGNYIVPLLKLYDHYRLSGESAKADKTKELAFKVARDSEREDEVKTFFDKK